MISFFTRQDCGGLKESLETMHELSKEAFLNLLKHYHFYAFDDRCNQLLWLLNDIEHGYKFYPVWIGIQL